MSAPLTNTQIWLKQHQITAFWNNFGMRNKLWVPKEQTHELYLTGPEGRIHDQPTKNRTVKTISQDGFLICLIWISAYSFELCSPSLLQVALLYLTLTRLEC